MKKRIRSCASAKQRAHDKLLIKTAQPGSYPGTLRDFQGSGLGFPKPPDLNDYSAALGDAEAPASWDDLDERAASTLPPAAVGRAIRDLYESNDHLRRELETTRQRANTALGYAAAALLVLGFTLLLGVVRELAK